MPEDFDIGSALEEAVGGEEMISTEGEAQPSATDGSEASTEPQAPVEDNVQEAQEQQAQFDTEALNNQLNEQSLAMQEMAKNISDLTNNVPKPQVPQPTEDDILREQMKKDLGLDKMEAQFKQQQELMNAQQKQLELQQQAEVERTRDMQFKAMEKEYGNIDKVALQNRILEMEKTNPALAEAMNSPDGVRMLLEQGVGVVNKTPDPITASATSSDVDVSDSVKSLADGNLSDAEFGDLLFNSIGN